MSVRERIINAGVALLAGSENGDISTRDVCEAAGVTQPVLYRHFGDKQGLLTAIVDDVWAEYLAMKHAAEASPDPLEDLRNGWESHTAFALSHPHAYRLVFATQLAQRPSSLDEATGLLLQVLERLSAAGRLRTTPDAAASIIMAANSGIALALILRPEANPDPAASTRTRDVVLRSLITDSPPVGDPVATAIATLAARLDDSAAFTQAEQEMLREWFRKLSDPATDEKAGRTP